MPTDFRVLAADHATVWTILAESDRAKRYAEACFDVEPWQGTPTHFKTDHRPARDLCRALSDEGFEITRGTLQ